MNVEPENGIGMRTTTCRRFLAIGLALTLVGWVQAIYRGLLFAGYLRGEFDSWPPLSTPNSLVYRVVAILGASFGIGILSIFAATRSARWLIVVAVGMSIVVTGFLAVSYRNGVDGIGEGLALIVPLLGAFTVLGSAYKMRDRSV